MTNPGNTIKSKHIAFVFGVVLVVVANIVQILITSFRVTNDINYGFPFYFYEYLKVFSRGRFLGLGILGDLLFAFAFGVAFSWIYSRWKKGQGITHTF